MWWCSLGVNIGYEQDGKGERKERPVLIIRKFNKRMSFAIPLSTKMKDNPFYIPIRCPDGAARAAIISQMRLIDVSRLSEKMFMIGVGDFETIRKAVRALVP